MKHPAFEEPTDEHFYARALAILVGPSRGVAVVMRAVNMAYWIAVLGALAWLFAQVVDRAPPVTIHSAVLLSPAVRAGDPVRVRYAFTRRRSCETDMSWSIYDGAQEVSRFGPIHNNAAGQPADESVVRAWPTPVNAAPGQGRLRVVFSFECPGNYLHAIYPVVLILPDVLFTIGERGGAGEVSGAGR